MIAVGPTLNQAGYVDVTGVALCTEDMRRYFLWVLTNLENSSSYVYRLRRADRQDATLET